MRYLITLGVASALCITACKKTDPQTTNNMPATGFVLSYMQVEETLQDGYLHLYGNFGDSTSGCKVKVSNVVIDYKPTAEGVLLEWKPWHIKLAIGDPNDNTGAGYVSVINGGKESNKRMLNVWELDLLYKEPDEGTINKEVRFKAYLRGDVDPSNSPMSKSPYRTSFSSVSQAFWAIGGQGHASYSGGGMTITLENRSGFLLWTKPYVDATGAQEAFQSEVELRNGAFEITGLRARKKTATKHSYLADGSPAPFTTDYNFNVEVVPLNHSVTLEWDGAKAIKAGKYVTGPHGTQYDFTWDGSEAPNHMHNFTLEWSKAEPRFK